MKKIKSKNLSFVFKYACPEVEIDETYNEDEQSKIKLIVQHAAKKICIDKTYVNFKDTKYKKTFISEEGWNLLLELAIKTKFGKSCSSDDNDTLMLLYISMIICYLYLFLEDFGYDPYSISISIPEKSLFMVEIYNDRITNDNYCGDWRSW